VPVGPELDDDEVRGRQMAGAAYSEAMLDDPELIRGMAARLGLGDVDILGDAILAEPSYRDRARSLRDEMLGRPAPAGTVARLEQMAAAQ
jgi:hypothetical protein